VKIMMTENLLMDLNWLEMEIKCFKKQILTSSK